MKKKYIYILSQRYSGSTLLSFLLGTHPQISTIGERRKFYNKSIRPKANETQDCSCGQTFANCDFWNDVRERVMNRVSPSDLVTNPTEFRLYNNKYAHTIASKMYQWSYLKGMPSTLQPFGRKMRKLRQFNEVLTDEIMKKEDNIAFLDSSKVIDHALHLSQIEAYDFSVIWLARDPRAQVFSALKYNDWTIEEATKHWKDEMDANAAILAKTGINHTVLRYEALCRNPEAEMRRILKFVDLDPNQFSLDFRAQEQHIMGNRNMRLGSDAKIVERRDWKEKLSTQDIGTIEQLTQNYQQYYTD